MSFTMFGFDGLGKARKGSRKMARRLSPSKSIKGGGVRACGCHVVRIRRKGGGTQPAAKCSGVGTLRFLPKGTKSVGNCMTMPRPLTGKGRRRGKACSRKVAGAVWTHCHKRVSHRRRG